MPSRSTATWPRCCASGSRPRAVALHDGDALEFDFAALARARGGALRVVGNLPYNISTPLLFHLLRHAGAIHDLHVMLQREVVARMAAPPGEPGLRTPDRHAGALGRRSSGCSMSVPVRSSRRRESGPPWCGSPCAAPPLFAVSPHFAPLVAAAFSHRRKTLRNALRELVSREEIEACGSIRARGRRHLAPQAFNALAQTLDRAGAGR